MDSHDSNGKGDRKRVSERAAGPVGSLSWDEIMDDGLVPSGFTFNVDEEIVSPSMSSRAADTGGVGPRRNVTVTRDTWSSTYTSSGNGSGSSTSTPRVTVVRSGPSTGDRRRISPGQDRGYGSRGRGQGEPRPSPFESPRPSFGGSRDTRPTPDRQPFYGGKSSRGGGSGAVARPSDWPMSPSKPSQRPQPRSHQPLMRPSPEQPSPAPQPSRKTPSPTIALSDTPSLGDDRGRSSTGERKGAAVGVAGFSRNPKPSSSSAAEAEDIVPKVKDPLVRQNPATKDEPIAKQDLTANTDTITKQDTVGKITAPVETDPAVTQTATLPTPASQPTDSQNGSSDATKFVPRPTPSGPSALEGNTTAATGPVQEPSPGSKIGPSTVPNPGPDPGSNSLPLPMTSSQKLYALADSGFSAPTIDPSLKLSGTVYVDRQSPTGVFMRHTGPLLFDSEIESSPAAETYYELSAADSIKKNIEASLKPSATGASNTSFLQSVSASVKPGSNGKSFYIDDVKIQLAKATTTSSPNLPIVFTAKAKYVNEEFESGFPLRQLPVALSSASTAMVNPTAPPELANPLAPSEPKAIQDTTVTDSTLASDSVAIPQSAATSNAIGNAGTSPPTEKPSESIAQTLQPKSEASTAATTTDSANGSAQAEGGVQVQVKAPVDIKTLSGLDRYPGHLFLGLDPTSASNGGFETLGDFCILAGISTKPWLETLLKVTKVELGGLAGTAARNVMWYLPGAGSMCCLRLEGRVTLNDSLKGYIGKYLGAWPDLNQFLAVAKRTSIPPISSDASAFVVGELVLGAELKVIDEKDLGLYISIQKDCINFMLVCYSKKLQWTWLKQWLLDHCSEVKEALEQLHTILGSLPSTDRDGKAKESHDTSNIFWRKLSVRIADENGKTVVKGISMELEASVSFLVPEGKMAVFRLIFSWDKDSSEFKGACIFAGDWSGKNALPPLQYQVDYERWVVLDPLVPTESYMSLRYIHGINPDHIPYGLPTELIGAGVEISNKKLKFEGQLRSIIKPDQTTIVSSDAQSPSLQIDHVDMAISVELDYSKGNKRVDATLKGSITLLPFREGGAAGSISAEVTYKSGTSSWHFEGAAQQLSMTALHSLFPSGTEKDHAMSILENITLEKFLISFDHSQGAPSQIRFEAVVDIASLVLTTTFNRDSATEWNISASLDESQSVLADATQKKFTLGVAVQKLLGQDVADVLPEFIKGTELVFSNLKKDRLSFICKRLPNPNRLVFGAELSFGMFKIHFAQVGDISDKKAPADKDNKTAAGKTVVKRLIRVSFGPLPSLQGLPLIGNLDIPCDAIEFIWASANFTADEITALNTQVAPFPTNKLGLASDDKELVSGYHFRLVGSDGVLIDYLFNHKPKAKQDKKQEAAGAIGEPEKPVEAPAVRPETKSDVVAPDGAAGAAATAPLKTQKNGLKLSGVGLSYNGGELRIHLDASLLVGPIGAGVQGLNLIMNLASMHGLHDLLHVPIDFQIEGFDISFDRSPVMISGALHHTPGTKKYYGGIAISLSKFSVAALGMYDQVAAQTSPTVVPEYDSFFVYGMLEGLLFTVGWAEFRGIIAGFGYNSRLRLPVIEELSTFPFLTGFGSAEGFDIESVLAKLCGQDGYITPSMGSLWMAAGLVIRACEAIDMRAVATLALGPNQLEIGLMARATATLPRGSEPSKALILIDLSVIGKLDLAHGELSIDGLINPTSFILNQNCRPSGGFSIRSWFGDNHKGDWVVSFGGYHPSFQAPAHYPIPPRLKISWTLSDKLRITGEAYAAVTPGAVMAGGMLQAVFSDGSLSAHFDAHADFLVNLKPLHYQADMAVVAGVSYEIRVWILRKKLSVEIGASLHLEGPPIKGSVHFDLSVLSFTVDFGSGATEGVRAISLEELLELVLQESAKTKTPQGAIKNAHVFNVITGLVPDDVKKGSGPEPSDKKNTGSEPWVVRSDDFHFQMRSPIPIGCLTVDCNPDLDQNALPENQRKFTGNTIISRPMQMEKGAKSIVSDLNVGVYHADPGSDNQKALSFRPVVKVEDQLPANYWGPYSRNPGDYLRPGQMPSSAEHLVGLTLIPPPPHKGQIAIPIKKYPKIWEEGSWQPEDPNSKVTRYVDDAEERESVKWSRVRSVMKMKEEPEEPVVSVAILTAAPGVVPASQTSVPATAKASEKPGKKDQMRRQHILESFVALAHAGTDAQSAAVRNAYHRIGAAAPRVVLREPDRFYQCPPTVFCN